MEVVVYVVWRWSGVGVLEVVIMMIECVRFLGLRFFLMNLWILWLCLLISVIMMMLVLVLWVIMFMSVDLLMFELVKRLRCCFWLKGMKVLIVCMLVMKGDLICWCCRGCGGLLEEGFVWFVGMRLRLLYGLFSVLRMWFMSCGLICGMGGWL